MDNIYEELENIFQNFRWIDNIPEDQRRRDEICMEARAALLLEANCTRERFPHLSGMLKNLAWKNVTNYLKMLFTVVKSLMIPAKKLQFFHHLFF